MIVDLQRKKVVMRLSKNKKINLKAPGRPFDNRGTTIVEIIIAFTMVGIVMTAFTGVIMLSYNFLAKSEQMVEAQEVFSEQFYTGQITAANRDDITYTMTADDDNSTRIGLGRADTRIFHNDEMDINVIRFTDQVPSATVGD